MIKPIAPCQNCTNRHVGCHSKCEIFKEHTEEKTKYQNEYHKHRESEYSIDSYFSKRIRQEKRKKEK